VTRSPKLLLPAAFITSLGNNIQLIGAALLLVRAQGSMLDVGWLFIAVAVPQAVLSPYFGRLADRFDRRRLWVGCDVVSAVAALCLPIGLALGASQQALIYGTNFALAVVAAQFVPASAALIRERVPAGELRPFNAHYEMALQTGMLLSASVGGIALQFFGPNPLFVFNGLTFVASALLVAHVGSIQSATPATASTTVPVGSTTVPVGSATVPVGSANPPAAAAVASTTVEAVSASSAIPRVTARGASAAAPAAPPTRVPAAPTWAPAAATRVPAVPTRAPAVQTRVPVAAPLPLGALALLFGQGLVVVTVFNALLPVLVVGEWGRGPAVLGVVDAVGGVGFLLAAVAYRWSGVRFGDLRVAVAGFLGCNALLVLQPLFGVGALMGLVLVGAFVFGQARIAARSLLMTSVDESRVGHAFGIANGYGLAATVVVMLVTSAVTGRTDSRYGFATLVAISVSAAVLAVVWIRRSATGRP